MPKWTSSALRFGPETMWTTSSLGLPGCMSRSSLCKPGLQSVAGGSWLTLLWCPARCLFSRPVLACLEMRFDLATRLVDLPALGLTGLTMELGPTGHPVLDVSQFPSGKPPAAKVPSFDVMWCPTACAYMASTSLFAQAPPSPPGPARAVFYPKKVAPEVHNLLVGDWLCGGQAFVAWWKGANQSRDFWLETAGELIRVHVVLESAPSTPACGPPSTPSSKGNFSNALGWNAGRRQYHV